MKTFDQLLTEYKLQDFPTDQKGLHQMHQDLEKLVAAERKHKRELQELRELRTKIMTHKAPDQKILALIDTHIKTYTEPK